MRLLPGFSFVFVLALLLIGTTPTGTGAGIHQFDLVHPLFSHVHIVNGYVLTHDQIQQGGATPTRTSPGPALGAGSGAADGSSALGISPILPTHVMSLVSEVVLPRLAMTLRLPAGRLQESPPHPPPTSAA
jgi:hypothetical protein